MKGLARSLALLLPGLTLCGLAIRLMIDAGVGLSPWDVFHQGLARQLPISIGVASVLTGLAVLLLSRGWLGQRIGPGTVLNVLVIGAVIDLAAPWVGQPGTLAGRWAQFLGGIALTGLGIGMYVGARLGAGPRDSLVLGLMARTGLGAGRVRTGVELLALLLGWAMGGQVGLGTLVFALAIGPAMGLGLRLFGVAAPRPARA